MKWEITHFSSEAVLLTNLIRKCKI